MISKVIYFAKRRWWIILILIVILGFAGFKIFGPHDQAKKPTTYTVKRQTLKETISFSGEIDAKEKTTLRFQTSGYLNWVGVKEGDKVTKFQVVASLDQVDLQKNLQKYLNTYLKSRWDFEQNKDDDKSLVMTDELKRTAEKYQFDLNNAVLDVELKNLALKYANLWTPIDGIVTRVEAPNAGVNITPTGAEIDVVNPQTVYFSAIADQTEVVKIVAGKTGTIILDAFPDEKFSGAISQIGIVPKSGETGTVYEVKINLLPNDKFRLGMTGDAEFVSKELSNVLSIPRNYLKTENSRKYVLTKNNEKVFVTIGDEFDNDVEIKSGLKEGDVIIQ